MWRHDPRKTRPAHALGLGRHDYWRFLRQVYGMTASEAWSRVNCVGVPPTTENINEALYTRDRSS